MRTRLAPFLLSVLLLVPAALAGQIPEGFDEGPFEPHPEAEQAIDQLYSPFCPGFMLEACPASVALRDTINAMAYGGMESEQLVAWMLDRYGEQYRAVPLRSGWGIWAWILPVAALLLGAVVVLIALRKFDPNRSRDAGASESNVAGRDVSREEEERLRAAIREIELSEDPSL